MSKKLEAITIPKWGIEMTHGTIAEWKKAAGEAVTAGEELVDIETDKIVNSFEARESGELVRILADEGEEHAVGTLIGVLALEPVDDAAIDAFIAQHRGESSAPDSDDSAADSGDRRKRRDGPPISPALARKLSKAGIDPGTVKGSGPRGRILKADVDRALADTSSGAAPSAAPAGRGRPLAGAQRVVAERLTQAQREIPLFHATMDVRLDATRDWLAAHADTSLNALVVRAMGAALVEHPHCNAQFDGERLTMLEDGNIAVAVATEGAVHAPVLEAVDKLAWADLGKALDAAIEQARGGRMTAELQRPAAATVSNLGMFGVREFTAMVTPPQVLVLSVGAMRQQPAVTADGQVASEWVMTVILGSDHRVINGAEAARLLGSVRARIEDPTSLPD